METSSEMRAVAVLLQRLISTLDQFKCNLQIARAYRNCCLQCVLMLSGIAMENNGDILSNSPINTTIAYQANYANNSNSDINSNSNVAWNNLALSLGVLEEFLSRFERYVRRFARGDHVFLILILILTS